jgi:Flp pilus assembly protein TadD
MKKTSHRLETKSVSHAVPSATSQGLRTDWWIWATAVASFLIAYQVYSPALRGAFVFDDLYLPFFTPAIKQEMLSFVGKLRPLLMLSFWIDYHRAEGSDPHAFHTTNLALHFLTSAIAGLIALRLLEWTGVERRRREALAVFAGALFLLHPLQTESVAYVASRSEVLSVLFYYSAFAVFLWRPGESMTLPRAAAILLLFGAAAATKEHTLTLPLLLVLTDYFWSRGGIRKNRLLYGTLAVAVVIGGVYVWKVLGASKAAGFRLPDLTPVQYLLTQGRVIWIYARMFLVPAGQNVDPDIPISHDPFDSGAIFGLAALAGVAVAAWMYRKRWPLASFGVFVFLLLLAPTSSFIPIKDPLAEHRVYLPFIGLALICCEPLRHMKFPAMTAICAVVLGACAILTYQRNQVWSNPMALWQDVVDKSPNKYRPRFQLAYQQYQENRCPESVKSYEIASRLGPVDDQLLIDWGLALECAGRSAEAVDKLRKAATFSNTAHIHTQIAVVYAKHQKFSQALEELERAETIDPYYDMTYFYRGSVAQALGDRAEAQRFYRRALELNPQNQAARDALSRRGP